MLIKKKQTYGCLALNCVAIVKIYISGGGGGGGRGGQNAYLVCTV